MKRLFLVGAVALAVAAGAILWQGMSRPTPGDLPSATVDAQAAPDDTPDISGIVEMTMGPEDAAATVIEYASFTCPHCARFHGDQFEKLKADYIDTGKVHFIYRDVYFDRFGLWAAMVARCGGRERFFGISEMLYAQQKDWIGDGDPVEIANNLRRIGKVAGLEENTLEACLADSDKARALVAWYQQNADEHGIDATPTLVINGQKRSNMPYDELKAIIEEQLTQ